MSSSKFAKRMAAKAVGHLARIAEYESGDWPSSTTVVKYFGSWNAALAASGFHAKLRSAGNQPRENDLSLVPGVGAIGELEKLLTVIIDSHLENDREELRSALLNLSIEARDWAMRVRTEREG